MHSLGGIETFTAHYGAAPLVTVPMHVILTLLPVSEFVPFATVNGTLYGPWLGAVLNWLAWMLKAVIQFAFGRYAASGVWRDWPPPRQFRRLPIGRAAVLACARCCPGGTASVNAAAGAAGVYTGRTLLFAGIGHAPQVGVLGSSLSSVAVDSCCAFATEGSASRCPFCYKAMAGLPI